MDIREAEASDLVCLSTLFDAYRQFYKQEPNEEGALAFVRERLSLKDSVIFMAFDANQSVGFVQLYPSYSSVAMRRVFTLNDLYVSPSARKKDVATALVNRAEAFASEAGAVRLELATEVTNAPAQRLYEKMDWQKNEVYFHYNKNMKE